MKTFSLKVTKREDLGKKSTKELRAIDHVPCVLYGGPETLHFHLHENELKGIIFTDQVFLVEIDIDGKVYKAIKKDIQFHPVKDNTLHVDFVEVSDSKPALIELPVILTGNAVGIFAGGKLRLKKRYLKVKGLVNDLPESLEIDITDLKIGDSLKISQLSYDNLELMDSAQAMVVGIATSRLAAKGGTDAVDAPEAASEEAPAAN